MTRLVYAVTMSLDGFIAGPGGDMSWLTPHIGPNRTVDAFIEEVGALLVGRRTYDGDDPHRGVEGKEGEAFGGGWSGPQVVVTRNPPSAPVPGVTVVADLRAAAAAATAAAGDKVVNVLGAQTARGCLDAGALDEVFVCIAPVLLGDGVRLFERPGGTNVALERLDVSQAPGATMLRLRVAGRRGAGP